MLTSNSEKAVDPAAYSGPIVRVTLFTDMPALLILPGNLLYFINYRLNFNYILPYLSDVSTSIVCPTN